MLLPRISHDDIFGRNFPNIDASLSISKGEILPTRRPNNASRLMDSALTTVNLYSFCHEYFSLHDIAYFNTRDSFFIWLILSQKSRDNSLERERLKRHPFSSLLLASLVAHV